MSTLTIEQAIEELLDVGSVGISRYELPWLLGTANITQVSDPTSDVLGTLWPQQEEHGISLVRANDVPVGRYELRRNIFHANRSALMMIACAWRIPTEKVLENLALTEA